MFSYKIEKNRNFIKVLKNNIPVAIIQYNFTPNGKYILKDADYNFITYCDSLFTCKKKIIEYLKITTKENNIKTLPEQGDNEFFPTPSKLAGEMFQRLNLTNMKNILEPSAGRGDLADYCISMLLKRKKPYYEEKIKGYIDVIEYDQNLQYILQGKGYRVIANDFLTFSTLKKYDAIIMNPPFSNGDEHLLKAIEIQKNGGQIVCILNADTIRNPYTKRRKLLITRLHEYNASIEFIQNAFAHAPRPTNIEIALIYINIPIKQEKSFIFENIKKAEHYEQQQYVSEQVIPKNWKEQMIYDFNFESKVGINLIKEYMTICPLISKKKAPILKLSIYNKEDIDFQPEKLNKNINLFLKEIRYKYWEKLLTHPELISKMTTDMRNDYYNQINEMANYDFNNYNINYLISTLNSQLRGGIEDSILKLFDTLSCEYSWFPESCNNIHYFNGWRTNKAHKVGMKCIIPVHGAYASSWRNELLDSYNISDVISDLDRALGFLDRGETDCFVSVSNAIAIANKNNTNKVHFTYFDAIFYKKGTCHIKFLPCAEVLIQRLNIFAAKNRQWLPPCYGKIKYNDMSEEEQNVIDSFQGKEEYKKIFDDPEKYIISPTPNLLTA